ncbi:MAG: hypothetical protein ABL963_12180 [Longimicrobiales bacterium]
MGRRFVTRAQRCGAMRSLAAGAMLVGSMACASDSPTGAGSAPALALSDSTAAFAAFAGGPGPAGKVFAVTNAGGGTLSGLSATVTYGTGQATGWLASLLSATTAPADLTLAAATDSVGAGTYEAAVVLAATGVAPDTVRVTFTVALGVAPTIVVTSPARSSMLQSGTLAAFDVPITGEACHPTVPIASLRVNGVTIPVSGTSLCHTFNVTQSSPWGLSTITVEAVNAYGRDARHVQSYLRSPTYMPVAYAQSPAARVAHGFYMQLNQPVIDDGNRTNIDDLASIAQAAMNAFNVNAGLATTFTRNPANAGANQSYDCVLFTRDNPATGMRVNRTGGFTVGTRVLNHARVGAAGVDFSVGFSTLNAPLRVDGWADLQCVPPFAVHAVQTGDLYATRLDLTDRYVVGAAANNLSVTSTSSTATLTGAGVDVDWGPLDFLDFLVNGTVQLLLAFFENVMEGLVADSVGVVLADTMDDFLSAWTVDASAPVNGRSVSYHAVIDSVRHAGTYPDGFVQLGLASQVRPTSTPTAAPPLFGAIRAGGSVPSFSATGYDMGVAIADDLVNQLLWSAWQAGSFSVTDVEAFTGQTYAGLAGSSSATLPPVVAPASGNRMLDVQWGDVLFDGTADPAVFGLPGSRTGSPVPFQAWVSAVIGVDLGFDDGGNRLSASNPLPAVAVQVSTGTATTLDEVALADAVATAIGDALSRLAEQSLFAVDVPVMNIGALTGVPPGTVLRLRQASVDRAGRYMRLTGSVGN